MTAETINWLFLNLILIVGWGCFLWLLKIIVEYWATKEMSKYDTKKTKEQKFEELLK